MRNICPICGSDHLDTLLTFHDVPVFVNLLADTEEEARSVPRGTQMLTLCQYCGYVFNCNFEPAKMNYRPGYHAEQTYSSYFQRHMQDVLQFISSINSFEDRHILEVGCGTGEFLREIAKNNQVKSCIGVDPCAPQSKWNKVEIYTDFFDDSFLPKLPPIHILINRHMIEHIINPLEMLQLFAKAMARDSLLYLETPRLDWILENKTFYDFPYEHCSYFSDEFMDRLLRAAGFEIVSKKKKYDGQYFSICARKTSEHKSIMPMQSKDANQIKMRFSLLEKNYHDYCNFCTEVVEKNISSIRNPDIYLWGAAAKGTMISNLLNVTAIGGCIDNNPFKCGKYIPGSAYLVLSPANISFDLVKTIWVENDVYLSEIQAQVDEIDSRISVISFNNLLANKRYEE